MEWEQIDEYHRRAKIPGGWLVKAYEETYTKISEDDYRAETGYEWRVSMCFVPDTNHEWNINQ